MARTKRIWREWQHPRASDGRFARKGSPEWVRRAAEKFRNADEALKAGTSAPGMPGGNRRGISRGAKAERIFAAHDASRVTGLGRQPVQGPERPPAAPRGKLTRSAKETFMQREAALEALKPKPKPKPLREESPSLMAAAGTAAAEASRAAAKNRPTPEEAARKAGAMADAAAARQARQDRLRAERRTSTGLTESELRNPWAHALAMPQREMRPAGRTREETDAEKAARVARTEEAIRNAAAGPKRANVFDNPAFNASTGKGGVDTGRDTSKAGGVSTTTQGRIPAAAKTATLAPKLSPEQTANYDKLLGNAPGEGMIKNPNARKIVEQMEQHGWEMNGNAPSVSLLSFKAPDGREIGVQFLIGEHNSKPRFFTGGAARGRDLTFKAAMEHVVTPRHESVASPNVNDALKRLGMPELPRQYGMVGNDSARPALVEAHKDLGTKGMYGGRGLTVEEAAANLRASAQRNRENAKKADELYGYGSARDTRSAHWEQTANQYDQVANELLKMQRERQAYEAERERRAALPLDIRPTPRGTKPKATKARTQAQQDAASDLEVKTPKPALQQASENIAAQRGITPAKPDDSLDALAVPQGQREMASIRAVAAINKEAQAADAGARPRSAYHNMGRGNLLALSRDAGLPTRGKSNTEMADALDAKDQAKKAERNLNPSGIGAPSSQHEQLPQHDGGMARQAALNEGVQKLRDKIAEQRDAKAAERDIQAVRDAAILRGLARQREKSMAEVYAQHAGLTREQFDAMPADQREAVLADLRRVRDSKEQVSSTIASNRSGFYGATLRGMKDAPHVKGARDKIYDLTKTKVNPDDYTVAGRARRAAAGDPNAIDGTMEQLQEIASANKWGYVGSWKKDKARDYLRNHAVAHDILPERWDNAGVAESMRGADSRKALALLDIQDADGRLTLADLNTIAASLGLPKPKGKDKRARMHDLAGNASKMSKPTQVAEPTAARPFGSHPTPNSAMQPSSRNGESVEIRAGGRTDEGVIVGQVGGVKSAGGSAGNSFYVVRHPDGSFQTYDTRVVHPKGEAAREAAPGDPAMMKLSDERLTQGLQMYGTTTPQGRKVVAEMQRRGLNPNDVPKAPEAKAPVTWIDKATGREVTNPGQVAIVRGDIVKADSEAGKAAVAAREARRSANLAKAQAAATEKRVSELEASKDPRDNAGKIKAITDGRMTHADLYRTAHAGPSGQRAPVLVGRVRHTPDNPSGEFRVVDRDGQLAGWVTPVVRNGEQKYSVTSENYDGGTELLGWADSLAHAADVLTHGEAQASTGGTLDARRVSGRLFERNPARGKTVDQLNREALDREIRQTRTALDNPNLGPSMRASHERTLARLEAERNGSQAPEAPKVETDPKAAKIAAKEAELAAAEKRLQAAGDWRPSGGMRTKSFGVRVDANLRRGGEARRDVERLRRELEALKRPEAPKAATGPVNFDDIKPGGIIKRDGQYYRVTKVNAKSVKVEMPPGWDDVFKKDAKITEVHAPGVKVTKAGASKVEAPKAPATTRGRFARTLKAAQLDTRRDNSQNGGGSNTPATTGANVNAPRDKFDDWADQYKGKIAAPKRAEMVAEARRMFQEEQAAAAQAKAANKADAAPRLPGEASLGVTQSSRGRTTTVTLPDGSTATRTSKTMAYTHAVVVTTNNRGVAEDLRAEADRQDKYAEALQQWINDGADKSKLKPYGTGRDRRYYLPGFEPVRRDIKRSRYSGGGFYWADEHNYSLPDYNNTEKYNFGDAAGKTAYEVFGPEYSVKEARQRAEGARAKADKLDAGPAEDYHVYRWSQSLQGAMAGANEAGQIRNRRTQIVGVGGAAKVATPEEKAAAAEAKKAAAVVDRAAAAEARKATEAERRAASNAKFFADTRAEIEKAIADGGDPEGPLQFKTEAALRSLAREYGVKLPRLPRDAYGRSQPLDRDNARKLIVAKIRADLGKA